MRELANAHSVHDYVTIIMITIMCPIVNSLTFYPCILFFVFELRTYSTELTASGHCRQKTHSAHNDATYTLAIYTLGFLASVYFVAIRPHFAYKSKVFKQKDKL